MSSISLADRSALLFLPKNHSLASLRKAVERCKGCPLYKDATQAVFGEGPSKAAIMFIGEQPGDREDIEGKPFVGPAGRLLDKCMERAGIDRKQAYITNMVKHFKWTPRGKRRINDKPNQMEINACKPWLESEIETVGPKIIVALGATAAQGLFGKSFRVTRQRGNVIRIETYPPILATVHPSSLLRQTTDRDREREIKLFIADLKKVAEFTSNGNGN